jgi:hypothetical protein
VGCPRIGTDLHRLRQPPGHLDIQVNRDRSAAGERLQRRVQAALGEHGRMDAAGVLAQFVEGAGQPGAHPPQIRAQVGQVSWHGGLRHPQLQGQRDQALLGAVVQVTLDPAPGLLRAGHHPGPRVPQPGLGLSVADRGRGERGELGDAADRAWWPGEALGPHGRPRLYHRPGHALGGDRQPGAGRDQHLWFGPAAHHGRGAVPFVAQHDRAAGADRPAQFGRHRREDLVSQRAPRDERGHPAQRGLLPGQPGRLQRRVPQPGRQPAHHHRGDQEHPERGRAPPVGRLEPAVRRHEQEGEDGGAQHRGGRGQQGAPHDGDGQHHQHVQHQQVQRGRPVSGARPGHSPQPPAARWPAPRAASG